MRVAYVLDVADFSDADEPPRKEPTAVAGLFTVLCVVQLKSCGVVLVLSLL